MNIEFGLTDDELVNTKYAPLAALAVHYPTEPDIQAA
jgi:hypothetical protein